MLQARARRRDDRARRVMAIALVGEDGIVTVTNSAISGNNAASDGGGIANGITTALTIFNSTISANIAGSAGGGISHTGVSATLTNTIVAGNSARDCDGAMVSFGNNLDGDGTCNLIVAQRRAGGQSAAGPASEQRRSHADACAAAGQSRHRRGG